VKEVAIGDGEGCNLRSRTGWIAKFCKLHGKRRRQQTRNDPVLEAVVRMIDLAILICGLQSSHPDCLLTRVRCVKDVYRQLFLKVTLPLIKKCIKNRFPFTPAILKQPFLHRSDFHQTNPFSLPHPLFSFLPSQRPSFHSWLLLTYLQNSNCFYNVAYYGMLSVSRL
jgi:hypothetical protein